MAKESAGSQVRKEQGEVLERAERTAQRAPQTPSRRVEDGEVRCLSHKATRAMPSLCWRRSYRPIDSSMCINLVPRTGLSISVAGSRSLQEPVPPRRSASCALATTATHDTFAEPQKQLFSPCPAELHTPATRAHCTTEIHDPLVPGSAYHTDTHI